MKILKYIWNYFLVNIYVTRSYFMINKKKFEKAKEVLQKAEKLNIKKHYVYNNLAVIALVHDKDLREAARCLEIVLKIKPKFKVALINLSVIYIRLEQYYQALEVIEKAERCWYLRALAYNNHAVVLIRLKKYEEALEYAKKAKKKNIHLHIATYNIGVSYFKLKKYIDAVKYLEKAYKKSKEPKFLYSLAIAYASIGEYQKAINTFNKMPEPYIFDEDMTDWGNIIMCDLERQDLKDLRELVEKLPKRSWGEL